MKFIAEQVRVGCRGCAGLQRRGWSCRGRPQAGRPAGRVCRGRTCLHRGAGEGALHSTLAERPCAPAGVAPPAGGPPRTLRQSCGPLTRWGAGRAMVGRSSGCCLAGCAAARRAATSAPHCLCLLLPQTNIGHHPIHSINLFAPCPIGLSQISAPKTKFLGNSVEIYPIGGWAHPSDLQGAGWHTLLLTHPAPCCCAAPPRPPGTHPPAPPPRPRPRPYPHLPQGHRRGVQPGAAHVQGEQRHHRCGRGICRGGRAARRPCSPAAARPAPWLAASRTPAPTPAPAPHTPNTQPPCPCPRHPTPRHHALPCRPLLDRHLRRLHPAQHHHRRQGLPLLHPLRLVWRRALPGGCAPAGARGGVDGGAAGRAACECVPKCRLQTRAHAAAPAGAPSAALHPTTPPTPNRLRAALTARTARLCGSWRASGTSTWMRVREERSGGSAVGSRGQQAQRAMAGRRRQGGAWQGGSATSRCSPHPPLQSSATKTATQWRAQSRCGCGRCAAPRASRARACPCLAAAAAPRPRRHGWHAAAARPGSAAHPALPPAPLVSLPPAPQCREKPADDPYQFTHFCHELNSCTGGINPLPSDSRRRPDRALLELGNSSGARRAAGLGRSRGGVWRAAAVAAARVARGAPRPTRPAAHPHRLLRLCRGQVQP